MLHLGTGEKIHAKQKIHAKGSSTPMSLAALGATDARDSVHSMSRFNTRETQNFNSMERTKSNGIHSIRTSWGNENSAGRD